jgi:hypothetical protein
MNGAAELIEVNVPTPRGKELGIVLTCKNNEKPGKRKNLI